MRVFVQGFLSLFLLFAMAGASPAQSKVAIFGLKDQNDRYTEVSFPSDRPVVLIFGDRKGAGQIDGWSTPLGQKYEGKAYIFGIASLSGVPSYARGLVRRLIKRQTSYPVLLDWGGNLASTLGYRPGKALVVIVAKNGAVLATKYGAATDSELNSVYAAIDKQLS
jgi:hypothetical protein